ncbi:hypothetical protein RGF97_31385 [Streptomyces roseicoloratus]|uniref:Uncharacterized protein n=1 Tax=Streptomyces roseicoloratus TaxID=2508722 RepID=A0ABY9S5Z8_9ACTN|nr:hypothetical protein [Streptomyces roseicoloratus]WMX48405.1 hypothetical protein RGF97_31385 [Streptomyces roseicoloratus]
MAGPDGLLLVDAWPDTDQAEYTWETADGRPCHATVGPELVGVRSCVTTPRNPSVVPGRVSPLFTSFAHGWGQIFAVDRGQVTAASCSGKPVKVIQAGTVANGARTLYAVWFPDYTKGEILLTVQQGDKTSRTSFPLTDAGTTSCTATP